MYGSPATVALGINHHGSDLAAERPTIPDEPRLPVNCRSVRLRPSIDAATSPNNLVNGADPDTRVGAQNVSDRASSAASSSVHPGATSNDDHDSLA